MEIDHLIAFNIALIVAIISPGPALLLAISTVLGSGRKAGIAVGFGLASVAALWASVGLMGLEVVFSAFPFAYVAVKTLGALYLLYIAYGMWRGAKDPIERASTRSGKGAFRRGLFVNILNPKSALFAAAVLAVIFPPNLTLADKLIIVSNQFLIEVGFYTSLAYFMSTPAISKAYVGAKHFLDRLAALVLGAFGLRLLADRSSIID